MIGEEGKPGRQGQGTGPSKVAAAASVATPEACARAAAGGLCGLLMGREGDRRAGSACGIRKEDAGRCRAVVTCHSTVEGGSTYLASQFYSLSFWHRILHPLPLPWIPAHVYRQCGDRSGPVRQVVSLETSQQSVTPVRTEVLSKRPQGTGTQNVTGQPRARDQRSWRRSFSGAGIDAVDRAHHSDNPLPRLASRHQERR